MVPQVMKYLFSGQPELRRACEQLLRVQPDQVTADTLLQDMITQVRLCVGEGTCCWDSRSQRGRLQGHAS